MGHRGLIGFVIDGQEKLTYSHWGSYPEGNGLVMLDFARRVNDPRPTVSETGNATTAQVLDEVRALKVVDGNSKPTLEDQKKLARYLDPSIRGGEPDDWYVLLRETQGNPDAILDCGYIIDSASFAADSLFNEGSYLIDFDAGTFEAYDGFVSEPHNDGRFAHLKPRPNHNGVVEYYPIRLVGSWPLTDLPTDKEFLAHMPGED